ncbi:hypothetical protein SALBM311S_01349 [Streptomyces alboniger]
MPDFSHYQTQSGWTASRRAHAQAEARARFERDWQAAQAAETQRQQQLASYQREYQQWVDAQLADVRRHNAGISAITEGVMRRDPDSVIEYFSAALYASTAWPEGFPRQVAAAYDPAARQLVLDWELPAYSIVPEIKAVRYMSGADQDKETPRPVGQRRALYREVLAQCMLLVLHELFGADELGALESVALNGFVDGHDPTTGRPGHIFLATVMASCSSFRDLHLAQVDASSCLADALRGQLSVRPDQLTPVRPSRRPQEVGSRVVAHGSDEEPDLFAMDPIAFEDLVADLFRAMGMQAVTTQRSNDGGVDVDALDPTPIRGGKIVVQVKRYRNTVPPTAVRDLYGTVQDVGANKGVLVTTSGFGPGSHTFANGKPLELISGPELVDLLHRHGLRGRLGEGGRQVPAQATPSRPDTRLPDDYNVLGMSWTGCCLGRVCSRLPWQPGPQRRSLRSSSTTRRRRTAQCVPFPPLHLTRPRSVSRSTGCPMRPTGSYSWQPSTQRSTRTPTSLVSRTRASAYSTRGLAELGQLEVSDGRLRETALVLGSFRRRPNGDWDFVMGGKGYTGGLEELVQDFGIEVE